MPINLPGRLLALGTLAAACAVPAAATAHLPIFRDGRGLPAMVTVPAGTAVLGSTEAETAREGRAPALAAFERPQRSVRFDRPFAMARDHVTQGEFARFVRATGRKMDGCLVALNGRWSDGPVAGYDFRRPGWKQAANEPAVCVDWTDAAAYAEWLSARTGQRYRLPSEDEWEYAARGGRATARWWGDDPASICSHANGGDRSYAAIMPDDKTANLACRDGFARTNPANRFPANPFGLRDMLGNAWQWTADCFAATAGAKPREAPCPARSIRGGSWHNSVSTLRSATRFSLPPTMRSASVGFRVVRELPDDPVG